MNPWGLFVLILAALLIVAGVRNDIGGILTKLRGQANSISSSAGAGGAATTAPNTSAATNGTASAAGGGALPQALADTIDQDVAAQIPYKWGGASQLGMDCSAYVQALLASVGIHMGRTTYQQVLQGSSVPVAGTGGLGDAVPGDLLFFDGNSHEAMYLGNGEMTDEPHTGGHAEIIPVYARPDAIRRVLTSANVRSAGTVYA